MPKRDPARFQPDLNRQALSSQSEAQSPETQSPEAQSPETGPSEPTPLPKPLRELPPEEFPSLENSVAAASWTPKLGQQLSLAAAPIDSQTAHATKIESSNSFFAIANDEVPRPNEGLDSDRFESLVEDEADGTRDNSDSSLDEEDSDSSEDSRPGSVESDAPGDDQPDDDQPDDDGEDSKDEQSDDESTSDEELGTGLRIVPIPKTFWDSIPADCLKRMLEFDSVQQEYQRTFKKAPDASLLDSAPRLALEDIIDQAMLNSRDLQTAKEALYQTALALSLDRFAYELNFSKNTGTDIFYNHSRFGSTTNSLRFDSNVEVGRLLYTGAEFVARFANSVVLTFNGPTGFSTNVGSEIFVELSQSLLQRDIRFESLTQAERNVVYAARDYARFRKQLFVELANQYYSRILDFRSVEIESQNYFTLVRQFNQGEAEFRAGLSSRIQLDQIEQQVIGGRRDLLSLCTQLENAIDGLKIDIGLPTEEPMNLDLTELQLITLRDELAVNGELIERVRNRLRTERRKEFPARATLLSAGAVLVERMRDSNDLRNRLGEKTPQSDKLVDIGLKLQTNAARLDVEDAVVEIESELRSETPSQPIVFQRRMDIVTEQLEVIQLQLDSAARDESVEEILPEFQQQADEFELRALRLGERFVQLIADERIDEFPVLLADSEDIEEDTAELVEELDKALGNESTAQTPDEKLQSTIEQVDSLFTESESFRLASQGGLTPIEMDMDDAMMTALVSRFELMTQRGQLADDWRLIKLAADELKAVLNVRGTHSIGTQNNRPFDFTFENSNTSLGITFDAPLNRRSERNNFRRSLINYQASLRDLALVEDAIKRQVRRIIRGLALDREQYTNNVASAALAFERVVSTELELRLGVGSVVARDFLEAQTAYTSSLQRVAGSHIGYLVDRLSLFFELESLEVGDDGFWLQLYDVDTQPMPFYQLPNHALPAYGRLHPCLDYSPEIRRMLCVPAGTAMNLRGQ